MMHLILRHAKNFHQYTVRAGVGHWYIHSNGMVWYSHRFGLFHLVENVYCYLSRFHTDTVNGTAPYFVFGDFNFRCDTEGVVKKLTKDLSIHRTLNIKNDHTKLQYRDDGDSNILTIGKKEFLHAEHQTKFKESWVCHNILSACLLYWFQNG